MKKITINDVADFADVGIATASRALNNKKGVSLETKRRVENAAKILGFQFNDIGRALKKQRTKTIGVLLPTLQNPVYASAIEGIQKVAGANGYQTLFSCVNYDPEQEEVALLSFLSKKVDGIILTVSNPENSSIIKLLDKQRIPYCLLFNNAKHDCDLVAVDNFQAAYQVGQYLMAKKHQYVAYITLTLSSSERAKYRYQGLCKAFSEQKLTKPLLIEIDTDMDKIEAQLMPLVDKKRISAIFVSNDLLAIKCINALKKMNIDIPKDISVIGFDGIDIGQLITPSLVSVKTPNELMGQSAAKILINRIKNKNQEFEKIYCNYDICAGESVVQMKS